MHRSSLICVDANLVVRLLASPSDDAVRRLWSQWRTARLQLVAPGLLRYEVTNAFHRLSLAAPRNRAEVRRGLADALALPIELINDAWLHESALEFAERFHLKAAYDAHYLALADRLACPFWTADRRLYNSVSRSLPWVQLADS